MNGLIDWYEGRRNGSLFRMMTRRRWDWRSITTASSGCPSGTFRPTSRDWKSSIWIRIRWRTRRKTPTNGCLATTKAAGSKEHPPADVATTSVYLPFNYQSLKKKKKKFVNIFQFWANKIIALLIDWSISDVSETFHMNPQYRITLEDPDGNWRELMAAFLGFDY